MIETLLGFQSEFLQAIRETFLMLVIGLSAALTFGSFLGVLLFVWRTGGIRENKSAFVIAGGIVNLVRSFPFVILLIVVTPFTKLMVGTSIGPIAASVPLSISAIAYFARLVEISLNEVPKGVIEASLSMGASLPRVIGILILEASPALILAVTTLSISYLSYSAAAGIVGGGGIGDFAIRFGYYRFQTDIMIFTVICLILTVQVLQMTGNFLSTRFNKR